MLRPVWDAVGVRDRGSLRRRHPGGCGNPGSGGQASGVDEADQGKWTEEVGRAQDRVPDPQFGSLAEGRSR